MVYYYTSGNVKILKNIIIDFEDTSELSPEEYMEKTITQLLTDAESKITWIAETFINIEKHEQFLKQVAAHLSEKLSNDDKEYFIIILHAITFQIMPSDMLRLYKCLFNLSKPLLHILTNFLSNNEVLTFLSEIAQTIYDTNYITEKIIGPLFMWQPYISEMSHSYAEYLKKAESLKIKLPTVPIQPNVLSRKIKNLSVISHPTKIPATPPNSVYNIKKGMLTKDTIDKRLKNIYEDNKQRALILLNEVKNKNYGGQKPESKNKINPSVENDPDISKTHLLKSTYSRAMPVKPVAIKQTAANLKRFKKIIEISEQEEVQWLQDLIGDCRNTAKIQELEDYDRQERERERLLDIEKKHLLGQISYEEAVIAKKKVQDENKKKYEAFLKEKELWVQEIENWKKEQMENNRKNIERLSLIELNLKEAKRKATEEKKTQAQQIKQESELLLMKALKEKQEELEQKIQMIKEIKVLAAIAKKAKVPKIIDLTETSGLGLFCEMSMAELQERISAMKICLKEELERKKEFIKQENINVKQELEETREKITDYLAEKALLRKKNKKPVIKIDTSSKEIRDLRRILEEKRNLRIKLSNY